MSAENLTINLSKSEEGSFGFSLLGKFAGIPHVIYDVIEDSPAAESEVSESLHFPIFLFDQERVHCFLRYIRLINDLIDTRSYEAYAVQLRRH